MSKRLRAIAQMVAQHTPEDKISWLREMTDEAYDTLCDEMFLEERHVKNRDGF